MSVKSQELEFIDARAATTMVSHDGKIVCIEYDIGADKNVRIGLSLEETKKLIHDLGVLASASLDKTAIGGAGFVRTTRVIQAEANATDAPDVVLLALKNEINVFHYFELPVATSAALRPQLRNAETRAGTGFRLPRA